ncbi:MAG: restriction endonuclease, partial [Planctomycetes bacterium]|nr:restriction endonuclease [Planctomycetota bacterium]
MRETAPACPPGPGRHPPRPNREPELRRSANSGRTNDSPGRGLEKAVARIQQLLDPNSTVTHDEILADRIGNKRQYDVIIRGRFGGRPILGVIECKDHARKKGPGAIEAFAKKTEHVRANLRAMVSTRGFTKQALKLAEHENIGCLSLIPNDTENVGFSIGDMWYGVIKKWVNVRLCIHFALPT